MKNDLGRYRKTYIRLWRHPGFAQLTDGERVLVLYLLTGPQTNRLGLYNLSVATAAEDLETLSQTITKRLAKVCVTFGWMFDKRSRVLFIPSWFKWNPPENENVMKGSLKDLNEIAPCGLVDAFARNIGTLPETLRGTFVEGLRQRLPQGMPNQEQEAGTVSEAGSRNLAFRTKADNEKQATEVVNGQPSKRLVAMAKETLQLTSASHSLDVLVEAFQSRYHDVPRQDAIAALNVVLSERRVTTT